MSENDPQRTKPDVGTHVTFVPALDEQARIATEASGVTVPGFEVEGVLGRGSYGIVYRARQLGLNRSVALKVLIAGPFAGPAARARFLLEAESVAALEHPHIVRVFQSGEHAGHPYLAMEFVPGGTLADRVKAAGPLPAPEAARTVAALAAAVAHAHDRGVVHRDIKPGNVLLSADGQPRLTDFGLAKVGRSDMTASGQVLGTPAYMAPEQAAGKVREVGTAADVYALGAVLYDALTGRPPFTGDSNVVLQKVQTQEPDRPRKLNAAIPRDLETICLKCLEKEPAKRYPTAQALADDLLRYLHDEPIRARPAGVVGRAVKRVRRNKVIAGAAAAILLTAVVGAGASLAFRSDAKKHEGEAQKRGDEAKTAVERAAKGDEIALEAKSKLKERDEDLKREQEKRARARAQALLASVRADGRKSNAPFFGPERTLGPRESLTDDERETFWQLALLRWDEVAWMFLEEAVQTAPRGRQFENRAEYALHAAVGLDAERRNVADRLLLDKLQAEPVSDRSVALAMAASRQQEASAALTARAAEVLAAALSRETNIDARLALVERLTAATARLDPNRAADVLLVPLIKEADFSVRLMLVGGLSAVADRLDPDRAAKVSEALLAALLKETNSKAQEALARALAAATGRLAPAAAEQMCDRAAKELLAALARGDKEDGFLGGDRAHALSAVTARLDPNRAVEILTGALAKEKNGFARSSLSGGLSAAAGRLPPDQTAKMLLAALAKETEGVVRYPLAEGLSAVAGRLAPDRAADAILAVLATENEPLVRRVLIEALSATAGRLPPDRAATILAEAIGKETEAGANLILAVKLTAVCGQIVPKRAAALCDRAAESLLAALTKEGDSFARAFLAQGVAALTARLAPDRAAALCDRAAASLLAALNTAADARAHSELAQSVSAVVGRLPPGRAVQVCDRAAEVLLAALDKEPHGGSRALFGRGIAALAGRLPPNRGVQLCDRAAKALLAALTAEAHPAPGDALADGLSLVAGPLPPARAAELRTRAAEILLALADDQMLFPRDQAQQSLYVGLEAVASGIDLGNERDDVYVLVIGSFATPQTVLPALTLLHPYFDLHPLPPQVLVELLKHPFCIGEARRAVLNALGSAYNRSFKDQWEFVEYAQKHQPHLDLLTPPKRPEPKP